MIIGTLIWSVILFWIIIIVNFYINWFRYWIVLFLGKIEFEFIDISINNWLKLGPFMTNKHNVHRFNARVQVIPFDFAYLHTYILPQGIICTRKQWIPTVSVSDTLSSSSSSWGRVWVRICCEFASRINAHFHIIK